MRPTMRTVAPQCSAIGATVGSALDGILGDCMATLFPRLMSREHLSEGAIRPPHLEVVALGSRLLEASSV